MPKYKVFTFRIPLSDYNLKSFLVDGAIEQAYEMLYGEVTTTFSQEIVTQDD
jgi:hypothetical protein